MKRIKAAALVACTVLLALSAFAAEKVVQPPKWIAALYIEAQQSVGLRWMPVEGATGYQVLRSTTKGKDYVKLDDVTVPQYFDRKVHHGAIYYYVLRTVAGSRTSEYSEFKEVGIPGERNLSYAEPPKIESIDVQQQTEFGKDTYKAGVKWSGGEDAVAYNVYRKTGEDGDYELVGSVADKEFVDTNVQEGEEYSYRVSALDPSFSETDKSENAPVSIKRKQVMYKRGPDIPISEAPAGAPAPAAPTPIVAGEERASKPARPEMAVAPVSGVRGDSGSGGKTGPAAEQKQRPSPQFYADLKRARQGGGTSPDPTYAGFGEVFDEVWVIQRLSKTVTPQPGEEWPGSGELRAVLEDKKQVPVPLERTEVTADVTGYIARVLVKQAYRNPYDRKIEAVYVFPLPQNAAVSEFVMQIGDRRIRGIIREKEEAKKIYEAARRQGYVASLLTQERPNIFTQKVANIEPGKAIDIEITYFNTLAYSEGEYTFVFPMVVGPRFNPPGYTDGVGAVGRNAGGSSGQKTEVSYLRPDERSGHDIMVEVNIDAGVNLEKVYSNSHAVEVRKRKNRATVRLSRAETIPNKDLVLRYQVAGKKVKSAMMTDRDERGGYFTLMLQPPGNLEYLRQGGQEMVFVLDTSGSMRGWPIEKSKAVMRHALKKLRADDTFQLVQFAGHAALFAQKPVAATAENIERGLAWLGQLQGSGGTYMLEGIKAALDFPHDETRLRTVTFLTDGYIGNEDQIFAAVAEKLGPARIFSFGIGNSVNRYLMEGLARLGKGAVAYVLTSDSDIEAVDLFYDRIRHPAMTDISIDWGGMEVRDVYPREIPDLFVGRPVIVTGRFTGRGDTKVKVQGRTAGEKQKIAIKVSLDDPEVRHSGISRIWARARIAEFSDLMASGKGDMRGPIRETALAYSLMSAYTSFVAVDSSRRTTGDYGTTVNVPLPVPEGVRYDTTVQK